MPFANNKNIKSVDSKSVLIISPASVVADVLAILQLFH